MARTMRGDELPSRREGFLEALLGAVADAPVYVYDRDLRVVECFWDRQEQPWGVSPRELVGRRVDEFLDPEEAGSFERALREVFETGRSQSFECAFGLPVGRVWFDLRLAPIRGPRGEVDHVLAASYDLTERRRASEALFESEHRHATLAAALPVGVWRTDAQTRFVYANRRLWEILDLDPGPLAELDLAKIAARAASECRVDPEEALRLWPHAERAMRERTVAEFEMQWRASDASVRWLHVRAEPEYDPDGGFAGHVGALSDVTWRKRIEDELRESEHRYQSLAEAMPVGVWRTSTVPSLVYANRRNWELLDVDPDDPESRDLQDLLARMAARGRLSVGESDRLWRESEQAVQREATNPSRIAIRLTDGSLRHLRTLAVAERDSSGNFVGHVGVTIDVTDLEHAQQELLRHRDHLGELVAERTLELERSHEALRRSERLAAVGTFAAGIAHQINNPIGSILLAAQFAQEDAGNRERVEAALRDIAADARRCGRIVRGVLEFAQGPTAEPRPCDLNQIARDCVSRLASEAAERGAVLRVELDAELPPAAGSDAALDQVIANLVTNSIEAAASEIVVRTHARDGAVVLVVRDDGSGIEDENLDRIFDPLFTTRALRGGTGLGLALARGVVEAHGGSIEVASREGEGTEVSVRLARA